jgi:hypothetical protein
MADLIRNAALRALASGTVAGITSAATAALAGKREDNSYAAPLNATSHVLWGDEAAAQDAASLKYTLTGFLINHAAAVFWAMFYERLFGRRGRASEADRSLVKPLLGAAAVSAGAYITDYYLVPKRFTPGYEKRLSGKSMAAIYAMLALGFVAYDLLDAAGERNKARQD